MVLVSNQINKLTGFTLYSAVTSATIFHLLVKCVLLIFIIWIIFKWEINMHNGLHNGIHNGIHNTNLLYLTYKQKSIVISIICILAIIVVWFLKKQKFYPDDLFFISIILVIWVYAWRQNNHIAGFFAKNLNLQSLDIILPIPGTMQLDNQGLKAAPVDYSADKRSGVLPEHYDYMPDDMKQVSNPAAFNPMSPINSSDELPQFNRIINLMEPADHPVYKLTNEVLTALNDNCLAHDSTDAAKPLTEFMRHNGAGQSKWAFITDSEQLQTTNTNTTKSSGKVNIPEMFTDNTDTVNRKILDKYDTHNTHNTHNIYDTHEYSYHIDSANKKYPGVDNHCSLLGKCTNVNLPNAHSLNIIATNRI